MKRLLFATVATAALLLSAPIAIAQYGAAQPETTQSDTTAPYNQPDMPPPTETPAITMPDQTPAYGDTASSDSEAAPTTTAATDSTTGAYGATDSGADTQTAGASDTSGATTSSASAQDAAYGADESSSQSMMQHAVDAGMQGVPMTAADVCAPRSVDLGGSSRLSHDNMNKLENAADRASVCEAQRVVIRAPGARGDAIREALVEHGFDDTRIEVEEGSETAVEMQFAGVATSSEHYAQIFNGAQYASVDPNMTQGYSDQPGAYQPATPNDGMDDGSQTMPESSDETTSNSGYEPTASGEPESESGTADGQYDL